MSELTKKCQRVMAFAPKEMVDSFAKRHLEAELKKYQRSKDQDIADITFNIDSVPYKSIFDAIAEIDHWMEFEIQFFHPNTQVIWEYDTPTKIIKINRQGRGGLVIFPVNPFSLNQWNPNQEPIIEPAMFSSYLSYFYSPESIKSQTHKFDEKPLIPPRPLCTPFELWEDIRKKGIVPFQITICAYSKVKRYVYQLDVVNNKLIMDFRNGRIPIANRMYRETINHYYLDYYLSTMELPDLAKKVLQVIFDLDDVVVADIEIGLGITEKMARDHVDALAKRGIIDTLGKPPSAKYKVNLNKLSELAGTLP